MASVLLLPARQEEDALRQLPGYVLSLALALGQSAFVAPSARPHRIGDRVMSIRSVLVVLQSDGLYFALGVLAVTALVCGAVVASQVIR